MNLTEHHKYWQSIANQPYQQERLKTMNPLQAIAPLLNQINTLKNENTQPKSQTESLIDLNAELLEALKDLVDSLGHGFRLDDPRHKIFDAAKAAISKAEGRNA